MDLGKKENIHKGQQGTIERQLAQMSKFKVDKSFRFNHIMPTDQVDGANDVAVKPWPGSTKNRDLALKFKTLQ